MANKFKPGDIVVEKDAEYDIGVVIEPPGEPVENVWAHWLENKEDNQWSSRPLHIGPHAVQRKRDPGGKIWANYCAWRLTHG